jgi:hypothetical protein
LKGKVITFHVMKACHSFTTYALDGGGELDAPAALFPGRNPGAHRLGGGVDPRNGLSVLDNEK